MNIKLYTKFISKFLIIIYLLFNISDIMKHQVFAKKNIFS